MRASPAAAYARLHIIVPLALVAIAGFVFLGRTIEDSREVRPASALIKSKRVMQDYKTQVRDLRQQMQQAREPDSVEFTPAQVKALIPPYTRAERAAEREKLRCAEAREALGNYFYYDTRSEVVCDSPRLADGGLLGIFWASLGLAAICAVLWLFVQFREGWMLPNWSGHLWYTPAYAAALLALGIGPLLMLAVYHARASEYVLGADGWKLGRLGREFYLLVFLQLTAVCIAAVELRPSATRFIIGAPILLVVAGIASAVCASVLNAFNCHLDEPWSWLTPVGFGVCVALLGLTLWLRRRRRAAARAPAPFIRRVLQLSQILLLAWLVYAIDAGLRIGDARTDAVHNLLRTLCLILCVVHVVGSRWIELRFPERLSRAALGRPS